MVQDPAACITTTRDGKSALQEDTEFLLRDRFIALARGEDNTNFARVGVAGVGGTRFGQLLLPNMEQLRIPAPHPGTVRKLQGLGGAVSPVRSHSLARSAKCAEQVVTSGSGSEEDQRPRLCSGSIFL